MGYIVDLYFDGMFYFRNFLGVLKIINNEPTIFFADDKMYLQETNESLNIKIDMIVYSHLLKNYIYSESMEDYTVFCGFKCDDFIKKTNKIGKGSTMRMRLNKKNSRIQLVDISDKRKGRRKKYIDTFINNVEDNEELKEYKSKDGYEPNLRVDISEFSRFFIDLKNCGCTSAKIRARPTYMRITGRAEKKKQTSQEFGNKRTNFYIEGESNIFPVKYSLCEKGILMLSKLNTISTNSKLKIFFFKNKLVIKSKLNSNGNVIFSFRNTDEESEELDEQ